MEVHTKSLMPPTYAFIFDKNYKHGRYPLQATFLPNSSVFGTEGTQLSEPAYTVFIHFLYTFFFGSLPAETYITNNRL